MERGQSLKVLMIADHQQAARSHLSSYTIMVELKIVKTIIVEAINRVLTDIFDKYTSPFILGQFLILLLHIYQTNGSIEEGSHSCIGLIKDVSNELKIGKTYQP